MEKTAVGRVKRKTKVGKVVSSSMDKTLVVSVGRLVKHPLYGKRVKKRSKFKVHDEKSAAAPGDTVKIVETRPLSKTKRWRLVEVLEKAK